MYNPNNLKLVRENFTAAEESNEEPKEDIQTLLRNLLDSTSDLADLASNDRQAAREVMFEEYVPPEIRSRESTDKADKEAMSTPTREEFEARIETVEARMDARVARIEGKIDAFVAQAAERDKRLEMLAESAVRSADRVGNLKGAMWGAVLTIILSVAAIAVSAYYATQSSNIAIVQTTLSAFQQGQNNPPPPQKK